MAVLQPELEGKKPTVQPATICRNVIFFPGAEDTLTRTNHAATDGSAPKQLPAIVLQANVSNERPLRLHLSVFTLNMHQPVVQRIDVDHVSEAKEGAPSWDWPVTNR